MTYQNELNKLFDRLHLDIDLNHESLSNTISSLNLLIPQYTLFTLHEFKISHVISKMSPATGITEQPQLQQVEMTENASQSDAVVSEQPVRIT